MSFEITLAVLSWEDLKIHISANKYTEAVNLDRGKSMLMLNIKLVKS